jgi:hypothetical protein
MDDTSSTTFKWKRRFSIRVVAVALLSLFLTLLSSVLNELLEVDFQALMQTKIKLSQWDISSLFIMYIPAYFFPFIYLRAFNGLDGKMTDFCTGFVAVAEMFGEGKR